MTALSFALPYNRVSPLYLPRRDMVLDAADSLSLAVTITESDDPATGLIDLVTGPTFPEFTLSIWPESQQTVWDYGGMAIPSRSLMVVEGIISAIYPGTVDFAIPVDTMRAWPLRCGFAIRMAHDTTQSETLATGMLHIRGARESGGSTSLGGFFTLDSPTLGVLA
jgi:hypothetical protein